MSRPLSKLSRRPAATDRATPRVREASVGPGGVARRTLAVLIGCVALFAVAPVAAQAATASITGTVTSVKTGADLEGIEVTATSVGGGGSGFATTAANGTYTISSLSAGEYKVEFSDPHQIYVTQDTTTTLEEGKSKLLNAEMKVGSSISGTVTSAASGNGLGGVEVRISEEDEFDTGVHEVTTEPNGAYTVADLPPGSYVIEFSRFESEYLSQSVSTILTEGEAKNVSVALKEGGKISGRVTDAVTHNGLAKIGVYVSSSHGGGFASTNSNGEYTVTGLPTGSYKVSFYWEYSEAEEKACEHKPLYSSQCPPKYITQYFNDQPTESTANTVGASEGSTTSGINAAMVPAAPVNTVAPVVSGTPAVGSLLSCASGSWTGENALTLSMGWPLTTPFAYQWLRDGSAIAGATLNAYLVQAADLGHGLVCEVTATNAAGHASVKSSSLAIPLPIPVVTVSSAKIAVSGGAARVPIACAAAAACTGTVELTQLVTVRGHGKGKHKTKAKKKTAVIGKVSYSLAAGKSATLVVRLTGAGKSALGKARGHRLSAKLLASVTGGASVLKPVVLSEAKPKGKHK
jgi:Carboxypeptidase regulatory-like domain